MGPTQMPEPHRKEATQSPLSEKAHSAFVWCEVVPPGRAFVGASLLRVPKTPRPRNKVKLGTCFCDAWDKKRDKKNLGPVKNTSSDSVIGAPVPTHLGLLPGMGRELIFRALKTSKKVKLFRLSIAILAVQKRNWGVRGKVAQGLPC